MKRAALENRQIGQHPLHFNNPAIHRHQNQDRSRGQNRGRTAKGHRISTINDRRVLREHAATTQEHGL
jgi:hypothetical protein